MRGNRYSSTLYKVTSSLQQNSNLCTDFITCGPVTNSSPKVVNKRLCTGDHTHSRMLAVTKPQSLQEHNEEGDGRKL